MKKIAILTILSAFFLFTNCQKDSEDPKPVDNIPPITGDSIFVNSSGILFNGVKTNVITQAYVTGSFFTISGTATSGPSQVISAVFSDGIPTSTSTVNLATSTEFKLYYTSPSLEAVSVGGTAKITVNDTAIVVNFRDASFKNQYASPIYTFSGQLIYVYKPGGGTTTPPATTNGYYIISSVKTDLTVTSSKTSGLYAITGYNSSLNTYVSLGIVGGIKPTASTTVDFSEPFSGTYLTYVIGSNTFDAESGTADITVNGSEITISYTDVVFTSSQTSTSVTVSGNMYTSK